MRANQSRSSRGLDLTLIEKADIYGPGKIEDASCVLLGGTQVSVCTLQFCSQILLLSYQVSGFLLDQYTSWLSCLLLAENRLSALAIEDLHGQSFQFHADLGTL